jgi:predicted phage terminase large subunit-like protein
MPRLQRRRPHEGLLEAGRRPEDIRRSPLGKEAMRELTQPTVVEADDSRNMPGSFKSFFKANPPHRHYAYGRVSNDLFKILDGVTRDLENGTSRQVIINIPYRHGKSDIATRRYPLWHLLRNPDHEIMIVSYAAELAESFNHELRRLFKEIGPDYGLELQRDQRSVASWRVARHQGRVHATGVGGVVTGRGANLLIIDDPHKGRNDAESETLRRRVWNCFQNDLFTRMAPVSAVVVVMTRWHEEDLSGLLIRGSQSDSPYYDPYFPRFKCVPLPAYDEGRVQDTGSPWLSPERFSEEYYLAQQAMLGNYAWQALAQQNPCPREGNVLQGANAQIVDEDDFPQNLAWSWGWDIASTEKQRAKDDPDYTVGVKAAYVGGKLYIDEIVRGQWSPLQRNARIRKIARRDGPTVRHFIEAVGAGNDAFQMLRSELRGEGISVRAYNPGNEDKVMRAHALENALETSNVFLRRANWNHSYLAEIKSFPKGPHDDQVDATVIAIAHEAARTTPHPEKRRPLPAGRN